MDLIRFGVWFDAYREQRLPDACPDADDDDDDAALSCEQRTEIDRRLAELDADPSLAEPWEGTIERAKKLREEILAQKAPAGYA